MIRMHLQRIRRSLPQTVRRRFDRWEEPEVLINEALVEMKRRQIRNRERAVRVLARRNMLAILVRDEGEAIERLEEQIRSAQREGRWATIEALERERQQKLAVRQAMLRDHERAEQLAGQAKALIRREEELFRRRTSRAVAAKTLLEAVLCELALAEIQSDLKKRYPG